MLWSNLLKIRFGEGRRAMQVAELISRAKGVARINKQLSIEKQ
jgi:hypothetical protein